MVKSYIINKLIEARALSVAGKPHGNVPVKGKTAEVFMSFPGHICRDYAEYA